MNYVYILRCNDGTLYTGWTNDLINRVNIHNKGKGAKYTRARLPVKLVYYETYNSKRDALKREYEIKQYSKKDKESMISFALLLAVISEMTVFMK
jgi:putative endonuclease